MEDIVRFAADYQRMFGAARWAARLGPLVGASLAPTIGGRFSPYRPRGTAIKAAMAGALGLSDEQADRAWRRWLASHGLFACTVYRYGHLDAGWLARKVRVGAPQALQEIVAHGGLVLTGHTHHHNTLGCVLGLAGCHITGLAAPALGSPLYPYLGDIIERINGGSALHFGGGGYLFTDELKTLVRESKRLLSQGKVIVSLCDFSQGPLLDTQPAIRFLGKLVNAPAGSIEIAQQVGVPIYAAFLFPQGKRFTFTTRKLDSSGSASLVLKQYFDALADVLRASPWAWQGWEWFDTLPPAPAQDPAENTNVKTS
jgi:lauroyl/myristoyl acyltransferase